MASIREIRRRIRSVQNTAKITNALQLVAASKMHRAQQRATAARPYAEKMREVLGHVAALVATAGGEEERPVHPLLQRREVRTAGMVLITPDRGLCGGLPANLNRRAGELLLELRERGDVCGVAVGKKGRDFFRRTRRTIVAEFTDLGDYPSALDTLPIARVVMDDYVNGVFDVVYVVYAQFVNTVTQRPVVHQLLPVEPPPADESHPLREIEYIYEPSPEAVLAELLPRYVEMQLYAAVLESKASEQSARMVAMRNATENAKEMIEALTLTYNKARQEQITKELLDIVGGVAALEGAGA